MAVKIRLRRMGQKKAPFYRIIVADSRAPRDGRSIDEIGTYDPTKNPTEYHVDAEAAKKWLNNGAQPTDTARNILSREGVYMMKHLQGGVKKGAFDEATAQARFEAWKNNKQANLAAIVSKNEQAKREAAKAALEAEKKVNEAIAQKVAEKKAAAKMAEAEAAAEAATEEAPATEEA